MLASVLLLRTLPYGLALLLAEAATVLKKVSTQTHSVGTLVGADL